MSEAWTFTIQAATVKALLLIAAKQDIRYYLNGVAIDTTMGTRPVLVATDGHRLLAAVADYEPHSVAPSGVVIIGRELLAAVKPLKASAREFLPLRVTIEGDAVTIQGATTATGKLVDGRYPDWRRIIPRKASGERAQFNADYIADFFEVSRLINNKLGGLSPFIRHNGDGSALIDLHTADAFGICMPMRDTEPQAFNLPAWSGCAPEPVAAESEAA